MNQIYLNHITRFLGRWFEAEHSDPSISKKFADALREFSDGRGQ